MNINFKLIIKALIVLNKNTKLNKNLYIIKDKVIKALILSGQLKADSYHQFSRGGYSISYKSKHAKTVNEKIIGEFHSGICKYHGKFTNLNFDGLLNSHQDKENGHYDLTMTLEESKKILNDFLLNHKINFKKKLKAKAIAKRKNYMT
jgi:hypothetical protein